MSSAGAEWFQKFVFVMESAKYTVIEHCFPTVRQWYDKRCERITNRFCKRTDDLEEQQEFMNLLDQQLAKLEQDASVTIQTGAIESSAYQLINLSTYQLM